MKLRAAAVVLALVAAVPASRAEDAPWDLEQTGVAVPMRDGKSLAADVFLPEKPGRYPAVVVQTPYNRALLRPALRGVGDGDPWDREHYAYVVADWRGFFGSRAAGSARPGQRGQDGYDLVEWTAAQAWCDGKVGTWGPSALGRVQFDTANEQPPHLVCSVPLVAPIGQRYEDYYESGVLREAHVDKLDALGFGVGAIVRAAPLSGAPVWKFAASLDGTDRLGVPMLFITGWYDHGTARQLDSFRALLAQGGPKARAGSRLLVGPWNHMGIDQTPQGDLSFPGAAGEAARETRLFLDFHLRGVADNGWAARPRVRTWRINEYGWTGGDAWPATTTTDSLWCLLGDGGIEPFAAQPVTGPETSRRYVDDPAAPVPTIGGANLPAPGLTFGPRDQTPLLARDDVLVFTTPPLGEPLRLEGAARVEVTVRADRPSIDVAVRLCEVLADGRTMLVADAIRRVALTSGKFAQTEVTLPPLAVTFPKGARLRVIVAGSNWPRFERNPHTGDPHFDPAKARPANVEVLGGLLRLPVLPAAKPAAPQPR